MRETNIRPMPDTFCSLLQRDTANPPTSPTHGAFDHVLERSPPMLPKPEPRVTQGVKILHQGLFETPLNLRSREVDSAFSRLPAVS